MRAFLLQYIAIVPVAFDSKDGRAMLDAEQNTGVMVADGISTPEERKVT